MNSRLDEKRILTALLLVVFPYVLVAQSPTPATPASRSCTLADSCNSITAQVLDCTLPQDTRSCTHEIRFLGITQAVINDPACEAAKTSQNALYASQKFECESRKSAAQAEFAIRKNNCFSVATACTGAVNKKGSAKIKGAHLLWVVSRSNENIYERQAFGDLGAKIALANNEQEALKQLQNPTERFNAIISDFPGYERHRHLLTELAKITPAPQYIVYDDSYKPSSPAPVSLKGTFGQADRPEALFELVIKSVNKKSDR